MLRIIRDILKEIVDNQYAHRNDGTNDGRNVGINDGIKSEEMSVEKKVFVLLKDNPKMTAKQLSATLNVSVRQVDRSIAVLKSEGRLERVGSNKNGNWKVIDK